jgi:hypothetical protein
VVLQISGDRSGHAAKIMGLVHVSICPLGYTSAASAEPPEILSAEVCFGQRTGVSAEGISTGGFDLRSRVLGKFSSEARHLSFVSRGRRRDPRAQMVVERA